MADLPPQSRPTGTPTARLGIVGGQADVGQSRDRALDGTDDRALDGTDDELDQAPHQTVARSVEALRRARAEYLARHEPAPDPPPPRRWAVSRRLGLAAAGVVALVAAGVGLRAGASAGGTAGSPVLLATPSPPDAVATASDVVVVHVVGAVTAPGVVTLPHGSRVADAIEAAGGVADADLTGVNLARPLVDGEQLYVPRPGEVVPGTSGGTSDADDDGLVDLNRATQVELEGLPGVGPVLAQRIVAARPFASVDELDQVSGIGPATMTRLRDLVKV